MSTTLRKVEILLQSYLEAERARMFEREREINAIMDELKEKKECSPEQKSKYEEYVKQYEMPKPNKKKTALIYLCSGDKHLKEFVSGFLLQKFNLDFEVYDRTPKKSHYDVFFFIQLTSTSRLFVTRQQKEIFTEIMNKVKHTVVISVRNARIIDENVINAKFLNGSGNESLSGLDGDRDFYCHFPFDSATMKVHPSDNATKSYEGLLEFLKNI